MPRSATSATVARNVGSSSSSAAMTRQAQSTNRPAAISTTTTGTRSTTNTPTSTTTTAARTQPTTPAPATGTTTSAVSQGVRRTRTRTRYPEALPSEIDEVFSGPVQGTAVIGTSYTLAASTTMDLLLPKQHLAMMDQAKDNPLGTYCSTGKATTSTNKTAAMTPERRSDRGSERVFGSNSISPDDLSTSHEAFAHPQQQQHALLHPVSESNNHNTKEGTTSGLACPYGLPCVHIADSLPNVLDGGFVVFTDSFVEAHPQSRIAAVTQAYRKASEYANDEGEEAEKPDAEAQKSQLQKVRTYIKEVQEQSRPLFRRRPSEIVYGTAAYLPRTAEDEEHTARQHDDASGDEAMCHTSFAT